MVENFARLVGDIDIKIQEAERTPNRINSEITTIKHIIKFWKLKTKKIS